MTIRRVTTKIALLMAMAILASAAWAAAHVSTAAADPSINVIGGTEVPPSSHEWDFMAALAVEYDGYLYQSCGGSLIAPNWVLTAAHCDDLDAVVYGRKDLSTLGGDIIPIAEEIAHPSWSEITDANDLRLLRLSHAPTNSAISLASLAAGDGSDDPADDETVHVAGWGVTEDDDYGVMAMREADIEIQNTSACAALYSTIGALVTTNQICAEHFELGNQRGPCNGDSGGPLATDSGAVIGIVSFGITGCQDPDFPSVFTRVSSYRSWIDGVTNKHLSFTVDSLNVGSVLVGESVDKLVTINNTGTQSAKLTAVTTDGSQFSAKPDTCVLNSSILPGASCRLIVTFTPTTPGGTLRRLTITSDAVAANKTSIDLKATGIGVTPPPPPIAESPLSFRQVGGSKRQGKRLRVALRGWFGVPDGVSRFQACTGSLTISARFGKPKRTYRTRGTVGLHSATATCEADTTIVIPKSARRKTLPFEVRFSGNTFVPASRGAFSVRVR